MPAPSTVSSTCVSHIDSCVNSMAETYPREVSGTSENLGAYRIHKIIGFPSAGGRMPAHGTVISTCGSQNDRLGPSQI